MLVCCHPGAFFREHPEIFLYHFEMEMIALIVIYFTWFLSSSLRSISSVYFFYNVHATIMNLAWFNRI